MNLRLDEKEDGQGSALNLRPGEVEDGQGTALNVCGGRREYLYAEDWDMFFTAKHLIPMLKYDVVILLGTGHRQEMHRRLYKRLDGMQKLRRIWARLRDGRPMNSISK